MRAHDRDFMIDLLYKRSGLALEKDKVYLLKSRLMPIARGHGCKDLAEFIDKLRSNASESLLSEITEAMMTHESSFFRDGKPFEYLRKTILPQLRAQAGKHRHLRIWSAACATGQEPYSIAILLKEEEAQHPGWTHEIIATDLARTAIKRAKQGIYSQFEAQRGMPIQLLLKYFTQLPDTSWQVKDTLRAMVKFQTHNLLEDHSLGAFDLIFCRNVLFYFDDRAKRLAVKYLHQALSPHGYLVLGSTECMMDQAGFIQPEGAHGIYQKTHITRQGRKAAH